MDLNQERTSPNLFNLESILILNVCKNLALCSLGCFPQLRIVSRFNFLSESKRAISWVDKEDKLSPVASDYFKNFSSKNSSSTPSSLSIRRVYESRCDERE